MRLGLGAVKAKKVLEGLKDTQGFPVNWDRQGPEERKARKETNAPGVVP